MRVTLIATLLALPAFAQVPRQGTPADTAARFAAIDACTVATAPADTAAVVVMPSSALDRSRAFDRVMRVMARCAAAAGVDMARSDHILFRGGLARALWLQGVPATSRYQPRADPPEAMRPAVATERVLLAFAECLIAADRPAAEAFTRSAGYTSEERTTLSGLTQRFAPCTVEADKDLTITPQRLRAALALRLWAPAS